MRKVVGRRHEERLVVQRRARLFLHVRLQPARRATAHARACRDVVEDRFEALRRPVAVEPCDDLAVLVEEQDSRGELDAELSSELLLGHDAAVDPGRVSIAPDVERNRDEMPARGLDDRSLGEIDPHQLRAIGAAVLAEVDEQALVLARRVGDVLAEIEEGRREPRGDVDRLRRRGLRDRHGTGAGSKRQHEHHDGPDSHSHPAVAAVSCPATEYRRADRAGQSPPRALAEAGFEVSLLAPRNGRHATRSPGRTAAPRGSPASRMARRQPGGMRRSAQRSRRSRKRLPPHRATR